MQLLKTAGALILALTIGSTAMAQPTAPQDVATAAYDAMKSLNFMEVARHTHAEALAEYRQILLPVMTGFEQAVTADAADSTTPAPPDGLQGQLANIETLPADSFFARSLTALTMIVPDLTPTMEGLTTDFIGKVTEGDSLTHFVVRSRMSHMGQVMNENMEVVSLKQSPDGWKMLLTGNIRGLAEGVAQAFSGGMGGGRGGNPHPGMGG